MTRGRFLFLAVTMTAIAALVRLNNALTFPVLGGYDAFAHFTYIWFLDRTGQVPSAEAGWEFFQPPLYYGLMAAIWHGADTVDAEIRLRVGTAIVAMLGLVQAGVAAALVGRRFPADRGLQLIAAGSMLYLPMHLYTAGFVGNEGLSAVLCSAALLLTARTLETPSFRRASSLGLVLGLAMLAKYTAVVIVFSAIATIVVDGGWRRDRAQSARTLATVVVVMLSVCGWYYARNLAEHRTLFPLSREQLFLSRVENSQLQGRRGLAEYLLFDPLILYRPQWPRGLSLDSPRGAAPYNAMRESIPTGLYANTWFDGFGGFVLPSVTRSEMARRAGQALLTLAFPVTLVVLLGGAALLRGLLRRAARSPLDFLVMTSILAMAAVVILGTRSVPTQAAVKGTYLMPVSTCFAYLLASGLHLVGTRLPRLRQAITAAGTLLALLSCAVFAHGRLIPADWIEETTRTAPVRNIHGMLEYAGGNVDRARGDFEAAARQGWHLGYENLAALALEDGDERAAYFLGAAILRQPAQSRGTDDERRRAIAATQAEYANAMAVILATSTSSTGKDVATTAERRRDARDWNERAMRKDPTIPEAHYNAGVLDLAEALTTVEGPVRDALLEHASEAFLRSLALDPAFREATGMRGVALALQGECKEAVPLLAVAVDPGYRPRRAYPVETGPGDIHAAGLMRRRRISPLPPELTPHRALERCGAR